MTARVLFVDDEPDLEALVTQKFRRQLRDGTMSFLFAHDGVEALAALKENDDIDLVVTDINMPRMDGLSLLQKLQESEERKSAIVVSAYGDMANIRIAMNRGAFDFVTKPIDFELLATIITARLNGVARSALWPKAVGLNDREIEVLTWVARGKTSAEIAKILSLTKRTVDFHTDNARTKLGAATRTEAVIKAASGRLIEP